MNKQLRLGFIGGGTNSAVGTTHRIASQMDHRWRIAAGCFSRHEAINAETGALCGIEKERIYESWEQLLDSERDSLDAVAVLTPTPSHKEIVIAALRKSIPVICEKALAVSSADVCHIRKVLDEHNGFLTVIYNYTGYPMLRELRQMIRGKAMGSVTQIHAEMPQEGYIRVNREGKTNVPQDWRLQDHGVSTLALDLGVHLHNIVGFLTGATPVEAMAASGSYGAFRQVEDNTIGMVRYSSGMMCNMWYSKCALGHRNGLRIRVYGEKGAAEWYQADPERLNWWDERGSLSVYDRSSAEATVSSSPRYNRFKIGHPSGFIEAFSNYYYDIADCLEWYKRRGEFQSQWLLDLDHTDEGLQLMEALSESASSGCWTSVK